jgi:hypothetical protein
VGAGSIVLKEATAHDVRRVEVVGKPFGEVALELVLVLLADPASENEVETSGRMSAGFSEATMAASSATPSSVNFERITRCSGGTWRPASRL